jgi:hypothetical protein
VLTGIPILGFPSPTNINTNRLTLMLELIQNGPFRAQAVPADVSRVLDQPAAGCIDQRSCTAQSRVRLAPPTTPGAGGKQEEIRRWTGISPRCGETFSFCRIGVRQKHKFLTRSDFRLKDVSKTTKFLLRPCCTQEVAEGEISLVAVCNQRRSRGLGCSARRR